MDGDAQRFRKRYEKAKSKRDEMASYVDDAYEFCLPLRQRTYMRQSRPMVDRLFDGIGVDCLARFASRTLDDIWPLDTKPFDLVVGPGARVTDPEALARGLSAFAGEIVTAINNSRFRTAAHEAFQDYGITEGILLVEPGPADEPLRFRCIAATEGVLEAGPFGGHDGLYREREMPVEHVPVTYPRAAGRLPQAWRTMLSDAPQTPVKVLEGYQRKRDVPPGEEVWCFRLAAQGANAGDEFLDYEEWSGEGSCPFIAFAWSRVSGEPAGRGPALMALSDIRMANALAEMTIENLDLRLSGIWMADDDGVLNPDTAVISPGVIIPRAPNSRGLEPVKMPDSGDLGFIERDKLHEQIKRFFHLVDLGPLDQTPRSATEVMERAADNARALAGPYGALLQEFLFPLVRRVVWIAKKFGGGGGLPRLDGQQVAIKPLAPITRAMAQDEVLRHVRFMEVFGGFFGQQALAVAMDGEKFAKWLAEQQGVDPNLLRTKASQEQLVASLAAAAQQAGMIPQPGQAAA